MYTKIDAAYHLSPIINKFFLSNMSFRNTYNSRVVSVLDFNYELPVHSAFHPICKSAAKSRLMKAYPKYAKAIAQAFQNKASSRVWAFMIMDGDQHMCVVQNLSYNVRNADYRRVLRIDVDKNYPCNPPPANYAFLDCVNR